MIGILKKFLYLLYCNSLKTFVSYRKTLDLAKGRVVEAAIEHMNLMTTMTTSSSNEQGVRDILHIRKQAVNGFLMR